MKNLQIINRKKIGMLVSRALSLAACVYILATCFGCATTSATGPSYSEHLTITDTTLGTINARIFGKVLEKSPLGALGPERIVDLKSGKLPTNVVALIKETHSPLLVFPGSDADNSDWTDTINNAPGKKRFRPLMISRPDGNSINTRFGIDEFGRMKQELGFEAVLVVNLFDGLARNGPVREAAERAAGLIAYCNAQYAVKLPRALRHWPGIRAKNGNPIPFQIEYVQLGSNLNSPTYKEAVASALPNFDSKKLAQWYIDCITFYIQQIRAADPDIKIILDAEIGPDITASVYEDSYIAENINILSVSLAGSSDPAALSKCVERVGQPEKPIAITEWKTCGSALHSAAFLNGLIRHGTRLELAAQAPLLGTNSSSAVILAGKDSDTPHLTAAGMASALYAANHGPRSLQVIRKRLQENTPLDTVVTASETDIYLHAVNTSKTHHAQLVADCSAHSLQDTITINLVTPSGASSASSAIRSSRKIPVLLPPESVSVIRMPLRP